MQRLALRADTGAAAGCRAHATSAPPPTRRAALLAGIALVTSLPRSRAAHANLLDLPSCSKFREGSRGIKWCDINEGSGDTPLAGDVIRVDYTARAVETGEVYDGSRNFKFGLGNEEVIPGWEAAIVGEGSIPPMRPGGKRTVVIPPELAYGEKGDGCLYGLSTSCRIPPNSPVEITFRYQGPAF